VANEAYGRLASEVCNNRRATFRPTQARAFLTARGCHWRLARDCSTGRQAARGTLAEQVLRALVLLAALWATASPALADQVNFLFETDLRPFYYPGELVDWEVYISIEDVENNGRDSQGPVSFVFDIISNTGTVQAPTFFSPTSVNVPSVRIIHPVWSVEEPPVFVGGFGFFGINDLGNRTSQPGNVLGVGASIPLSWGRGFRPPYPELLHNIGYGTPPGIDTGGHQVPSPEMGPRDRWYLVGGAAVAPAAAGTYRVELGPGAEGGNLGANLISPYIDLNTGQWGPWEPPGGWIIPGTNLHGDTFTFQVIPEPGLVGAALLAAALLKPRRRP